jgi:uncharacterized protein YndB with AHSA1/START domain
MPAIDVIDSIDIDVPPTVVFDVVSNYPGITRWFPVYRCELLGADVIREGARVRHRYGRPFVLSSFVRRIDRIVPGSRLEEAYVEGDLRGTGVWTFTPNGTGTTAAYDCKVDANTWFTRLSFRLMGARAHSDVYDKLLRALKKHCEAL